MALTYTLISGSPPEVYNRDASAGLALSASEALFLGGVDDIVPDYGAFQRLTNPNAYPTREPSSREPHEGSGMGIAKYGNILHLFGGYLASIGNPGDKHRTLDLTDLAAGWTTKVTNIPRVREYFGTEDIRIGDHAYLVGGGSGVSNFHAELDIYDFIGDSWSLGASIPTKAFYCARTVLNGKLHITGGRETASYHNLHQVYDPATNTWASKAAHPLALGAHATCVLDGKIYSFGGVSGGAVKTDVYSYDPAADAWTAETSLPLGMGSHTVVALSNTVAYLVYEYDAYRIDLPAPPAPVSGPQLRAGWG